MIKPGVIQKEAGKLGVRDQQIEKDYVISWVLQGIAQHKNLSQAVAFKGGTVLKKIYFHDYRFSEDLDFTLIKLDITNKQLLNFFVKSFDYVKTHTNIPLNIKENPEDRATGLSFYIEYIGPLGGSGVNKSVKVDISRQEKLEFESVKKDLIQSYSDQVPVQLNCYSLNEVIIEKLRSIMQRLQARDFYDIWYLLENEGLEIHYLINEFKEKCASKGLDPGGFSIKLEQRIPAFRSKWKGSLAHQIKDLPDFEKVFREVKKKLKQFITEIKVP